MFKFYLQKFLARNVSTKFHGNKALLVGGVVVIGGGVVVIGGGVGGD